jgi:hypothetical protein
MFRARSRSKDLGRASASRRCAAYRGAEHFSFTRAYVLKLICFCCCLKVEVARIGQPAHWGQRILDALAALGPHRDALDRGVLRSVGHGPAQHAARVSAH